MPLPRGSNMGITALRNGMLGIMKIGPPVKSRKATEAQAKMFGELDSLRDRRLSITDRINQPHAVARSWCLTEESTTAAGRPSDSPQGSFNQAGNYVPINRRAVLARVGTHPRLSSNSMHVGSYRKPPSAVYALHRRSFSMCPLAPRPQRDLERPPQPTAQPTSSPWRFMRACPVRRGPRPADSSPLVSRPSLHSTAPPTRRRSSRASAPASASRRRDAKGMRAPRLPPSRAGAFLHVHADPLLFPVCDATLELARLRAQFSTYRDVDGVRPTVDPSGLPSPSTPPLPQSPSPTTATRGAHQAEHHSMSIATQRTKARLKPNRRTTRTTTHGLFSSTTAPSVLSRRLRCSRRPEPHTAVEVAVVSW
ncbi:hypothetical protein DFH09DRAFT_1101655, partial [Mycena vulgaris]